VRDPHENFCEVAGFVDVDVDVVVVLDADVVAVVCPYVATGSFADIPRNSVQEGSMFGFRRLDAYPGRSDHQVAGRARLRKQAPVAQTGRAGLSKQAPVLRECRAGLSR